MSRRHAFLLLLGTSLSAPLALAHSPYFVPGAGKAESHTYALTLDVGE